MIITLLVNYFVRTTLPLLSCILKVFTKKIIFFYKKNSFQKILYSFQF